MIRRDRFYEWLRGHPIVPDFVLSGMLWLVLSGSVAFIYDPGWPHLVLGMAMFGALVFREVRPVESFAAVALVAFGQWAIGID